MYPKVTTTLNPALRRILSNNGHYHTFSHHRLRLDVHALSHHPMAALDAIPRLDRRALHDLLATALRWLAPGNDNGSALGHHALYLTLHI